jgi:hypothetical protein
LQAKRAGIRERLLRLVPVYGHYRIEEDLREWDRSVRDESVDILTNAETSIARLLSDAANTRDRETLLKFDMLRKELHLLKDKIRISAYGYFPRFGPIKINEQVLKQVLDTDSEIVHKCTILEEHVRNLTKETNEASLKEIVSHWVTPVDDLVTQRSKLVRRGISAAEEE